MLAYQKKYINLQVLQNGRGALAPLTEISEMLISLLSDILISLSLSKILKINYIG